MVRHFLDAALALVQGNVELDHPRGIATFFEFLQAVVVTHRYRHRGCLAGGGIQVNGLEQVELDEHQVSSLQVAQKTGGNFVGR
ncbi:hypothetical protein D3C85_1178720 [compost metagenome]